MAKIKYKIFNCRECEVEFYTQQGKYCTNCGDDLFVDFQRSIWLERAVIYKRPWTNDEDIHLIESVKRGVKNQVIADELGRTKDSVAERLRRLRKSQKIVRGESR